jgi:H+-translocating NAD(P) transhydrogenase subunit alpha
MPSDLELSIYVFMLATFVGLEVIRKVSPLLHTPLMSITNAISGICVVGAILVTEAAGNSAFGRALGFVAVMTSAINIVSGFLITDRMLKMFKKRDEKGPGKQ